MRRFTVMGFTEAELGFVVAAVFAAIAAMALDERDVHAGEAANVSVLEEDLKRTREDLAKVHAEYERTRKEFEELQAAQARRSTKIPQCWEKNQQREPVAVLSVVDGDTYSMDGEIVTLDALRARLANFIALGQKLGCRFVVTARPQPGVDAVAQSTAVWRLRRYFDVNDRAQ